ncbi:MAG: hypothetical protein ETSY1_02910 [Candidatus Entotheonella factor]|uniref:Mycothiol-dependent maleylpyruvate isomerase metal-binding domain-containing protein n=1 Tax=Entotheonella factor TaxID=1429438 RepID=W4LZ08_ENTF1|nr:MAG: hypothetical protein ETSY1_02910 [Candidatus Entotheonella factor]
MIREAYQHAAQLFVATVRQVEAEQWDRIALGEWTVRDLVGHANRALLTVETYLGQPAAVVEVERPADYFIRASAALADPTAVAARGREAGQALGAEPAEAVREAADRVLAKVGKAADDACLTTPVGGMRLIDYLPTRVFELTVHTLDIAAAISVPVTLPQEAAALTLNLVTDLVASQPEQVAPLLLAVTGRQALPPGFSVFST